MAIIEEKSNFGQKEVIDMQDLAELDQIVERLEEIRELLANIKLPSIEELTEIAEKLEEIQEMQAN